MASTETPPVPEAEAAIETPVAEPEPEPEKVEEAPPTEEPPPEVKTGAAPIDYVALAEVVLRFLLFASAVVAVVVIVTSKQTSNSRDAKFNYSPALM